MQQIFTCWAKKNVYYYLYFVFAVIDSVVLYIKLLYYTATQLLDLIITILLVFKYTLTKIHTTTVLHTLTTHWSYTATPATPFEYCHTKYKRIPQFGRCVIKGDEVQNGDRTHALLLSHSRSFIVY